MIHLMIQSGDITEITGVSGNIDIDALKPSINIAQNTKVKLALGIALYNKIVADHENDDLSGEYLTIYNDYVVFMLAFYTVSVYLSLGVAKVANNGTYKITADSSTNLTLNENAILGNNYEAIALAYENAFKKYMESISIPEYTNDTDNNIGNNRLIQLY